MKVKTQMTNLIKVKTRMTIDYKLILTTYEFQLKYDIFFLLIKKYHLKETLQFTRKKFRIDVEFILRRFSG